MCTLNTFKLIYLLCPNVIVYGGGCMYVCVTGLEPGAVGLALSYAVTLTGMFQWGVRQSAEIENMVCDLFNSLTVANIQCK